MVIAVIGAGVVGSYLCHILCEAGHDVDLVARGQWKSTVESEGLRISHSLQKFESVDYPHVVSSLDPNLHYDAVFAVMQYVQMWDVLDTLVSADTEMVVLVGNNPEADKMDSYIRAHMKEEKEILFGFSASGGRREGARVVSVHFGVGNLTCGYLHGELSEDTKTVLNYMFPGQYKPVFIKDMDGWLKCHVAFILPICCVAYANGCDLRRSNSAQRRAMLDAAGEIDGLLQSLGVELQPEGEDRFYRPGIRRWLLSVMLFLVSKTKLGELAATDHCRNAVPEIKGLFEAIQTIRSRNESFPMPAWNALVAAMPSWESLEVDYS